MNDPRTNEKKRKRLSILEKVELINEVEKGAVQKTALALKYGISERALRNILRDKEKLKSLGKKDSGTAKSMRPCAFPGVEDALLNWVEMARKKGFGVTQEILKTQALKIKKNWLENAQLDDDSRDRLEKFQFSNGWVNGFVRRSSLQLVTLHGEGGSVNHEQIAEKINTLRSSLCEYQASHIYNVDETSLFFKCLPRRTYICPFENKKTLRGTKSMKSKDRVTCIIATNATGSHKIPIATIGTAAKPRCFRLRKPKVPYFSQSKGWADSKVFLQWFREVFLVEIRKCTSFSVALIMDNCGCHGSDITDPQGQVKIFLLPPNCTASAQPMDAGIIASVKKRYRYCLLSRMVDMVVERTKLQEASKHVPPGMKGLSEGYAPHILDALEILVDVWEKVGVETIVHCWLKTKILPFSCQADLESEFGNARDVDVDLTSTIEGIKSLKIAKSDDEDMELVRELFETSDPESSLVESLEKWAALEEDAEISAALVNDLAEEFEAELTVGCEVPTATTGVDAEMEDDESKVPVPPFLELAPHIAALEEALIPTGDEKINSFLRGLKTSLLFAERKKPKKQGTLEDFWKK